LHAARGQSRVRAVSSPLGEYLIESMIALACILALAVFLLYSGRRAGLGQAAGPIQLLARLRLEARRSVYLVRVHDQVLIIGSSEAGLARLGQLPEGAAAELDEVLPGRSFAGVLSASLGRPRENDGAGAPRSEPTRVPPAGGAG
jgi:flagellar biogenesis protein FliO